MSPQQIIPPNCSKRVVHYDPNSGSDEPTKKASGSSEAAYIDEVNHTYGYITGTYGIINEHQLMSGECTDYTKVQPNWDDKIPSSTVPNFPISLWNDALMPATPSDWWAALSILMATTARERLFSSPIPKRLG